MISMDRIVAKGALFAALASLAVTLWCCGLAGPGRAFAAETVADAGSSEVKDAGAEVYHTPLAGERRKVRFLGKTLTIPALDRSHLTSITLGGTVLEPKQGDTVGLPFAALYMRRVWENSRTRDVISVFVNEFEYDKNLLGPLELVGHFENYTIPGDRTEIIDNRDVKATSVSWGTLMGSVGPGLRFPVAPFQVDNDIRLQLLGRVGYLYAHRTNDSGPTLVAPPDTLLYGARLRGRYDGMRRNLLELPHTGFATGWDLDYIRRNKWRDLTPAATGSNHRDYLQLSGYFVGVTGIPGLSERDRVLMSLYGGTTSENSADRFNAFRINGNSFPSEADDMARPHYAGLIYDDMPATKYAFASVAYRRELTFFLYLSLIGSYAWADRATVRDLDQVVFREKRAAAATVSIDMAFLWQSEIYLAYTWESGLIRGGRQGSGIALNWNKLF